MLGTLTSASPTRGTVILSGSESGESNIGVQIVDSPSL